MNMLRILRRHPAEPANGGRLEGPLRQARTIILRGSQAGEAIASPELAPQDDGLHPGLIEQLGMR